MSILHELVRDIPIPRMVRIQQMFSADRLTHLEEVLTAELAKAEEMIQPGMEIAIAVGSRGVDRIAELTRLTAAMIKRRGGKPFIVPSMGSHGGATAEGQVAVLRHLGVTEESVGAEIRATMEVERIGTLPSGLPVFIDRYAAAADGIVVINRNKPHTAFRGPVESGLLKMISIGLGKQKGAEACHQLGFGHMAENVPAMARMVMERLPVLFGVGTVENAYDQIAKVVVVSAAEMEAVEMELLKEAKRLMPRIMFDQIDVLVIDEIGKNISGDGMDPNITGRYPTPFAQGGPDVGKMVVLGLTKETEGNANGIGTADFTTQRLVDQIDREKMYANGLTSTVVAPTKIPTTLACDREAIQAAIKTCNILHFPDVRLVRIKNTLELGEIEISEALLEEAKANPSIRVLTEPYAWSFTPSGDLT